VAARFLEVLGLSAVEEDLYRHLLRHPGSSLEDVHVLLGHPPDAIATAAERLRDSRVITERDDGATWPVEPDIAVGQLAEQRLQDLYRDIRAVTSVQPILAALRREGRGAHDAENGNGTGTGSASGAGDPLMERLTELPSIRSRIDDLAFFARQEILAVEPYDALTAENIEHSRPLDLRCLRRGVRMRSLVRARALRDARTAAYLQELHAAGTEIRVAGDLTELMLIYDRHTALVPLDPEDTSRGALCTREEALVGNFVQRFEYLWQHAAEFTDAVSETGLPEPGPELPEVRRKILWSMCSEAKDETRARGIGMSLRTYRRHLARLMEELGAENRAHAALLARERGWI
jgi:hypothetical protein